ncbi:hypothetical protein RB195_020604 [Necator americanus]|uniref:Uncharacterized protein n=1 Tax=Necator americanus TaxID=51031 RepID=A0ABR1CLP4_NECAM
MGCCKSSELIDVDVSLPPQTSKVVQAVALEAVRWSVAATSDPGLLLGPLVAAAVRDGPSSIQTASCTAPLRAQPLAQLHRASSRLDPTI